jgi:AraC-like DNA-binding protein
MFFYESNRFGENDTYIVIHSINRNFPVHLHRCFEFIYVNRGQIGVEIDNEKVLLDEGEMVLIFPNQLHSYNTADYSDTTMCIFSPEYISMFYQLTINKKQETIVTKLNNETKSYLLACLPESSDNKFLIKSCLYVVCADIFGKTRLVDKNLNTDIILQHRILTFIEENFTEDISLRKIANMFGYNYQYLSRYFNTQFKIPFVKMINERRISYAEYLLRTSDKSITDIALSSGFKSIRSFNRNFQII